MEFEPWPAALAAFLVVVQVVLVMAPGVYYTRKGTIDTSARRKLSIISFSLLLPANNFYHIAKNVSADTITQYLPFAANTVLSNVLGMICGWLSNWLAGTPRTLRYHVVAAAGFGNLNSLPLLIATAICNQDSLPFQQVLKEQCSSVGYGYVAVGTAATQMFTYPLAIWLLKKRPEPRPEPELELAEVVVAAEQPGSSAPPSACRTPSTDTLSAEAAHAAAADLDSAHSQAPEKAVVGEAADLQPGHPPDASQGASDAPRPPLPEAATRLAHDGSAAPARTPSSRRAALQSFAVDVSSDSGSSMAGSPSSRRRKKRQVSRARSDSSAAAEDLFHSASAGGSSSSSSSGSGSGGCRPGIAETRSTSLDSTRPDAPPTTLVPAAAGRIATDASQGEELEAAASQDQKVADPCPSVSQGPAPDPPAASRLRSRWRRRVWALGAALGGQQPRPQRPPGPPPSRARRWARSVWKFTNENVLRMPCIGAGLGLVVGVIQPIKDLLFPASSAPLGFLMGALFSIQAALIFNSSFVLGSTLAKGPGPGRRALGWRPLLLVVLVRLVLLPVVGAVLVTGFIKLGWYRPLDPVYAYILLQQFCVPTANQMQNIASMSGNREQEMGTLIFFQYVFAFVAIPAWMVFYLWLMDRFSLYPGA